jgi:hypothetical protein
MKKKRVKKQRTIRDYMRYAKFISKGVWINPEYKDLFI